MYINVTTSNSMDFDDIYRNAWGGAVDTLDIISNEEKENELNDFLVFEDDYIFNELGINLEEGEEE